MAFKLTCYRYGDIPLPVGGDNIALVFIYSVSLSPEFKKADRISFSLY